MTSWRDQGVRAALADSPPPGRKVAQEALTAGISPWTLGEARKQLDVPLSRVGFGPGSYQVWSPPEKTAETVRDTPPAVSTSTSTSTSAPYLGLDHIVEVSLENQSYGGEPKVCEDDEDDEQSGGQP